MKNLIPLLLLIVSFTGCKSYQYISVNSTQLLRTGNDEFVAENDSVKITYNFNGKNLPVNIRVMNKLDKVMVIDWKRTSLIINDQSYSFFREEKVTRGRAETSTLALSRIASSSYTEFRSVTQMPPDGETVPPKSFVTRSSQFVTDNFIEPAPGHPGFGKTKYSMPHGPRVRVRMASFEQSNSPLVIRTYLSMLIEEGGKIQTIPLEHNFYVSSLIRTDRNPFTTGWNGAYVVQAAGVQ
ncbi:hypothetical protein HHL16_19440 [Pseudoflavitalea sp. G-6-1-2]|uniref:hypothetical protein n=1 Tax=Pseudoflavitalea sp. G-6-1-2 TaxID=2728841 RepID=UPI00146E1DD3|nr:hypothetical protein [Pseudoflavitalea sp. G-6-1-2]NML23061.1 hypothetical protein [Pseudoflavitalea sp. G-6-1-2]